MEVPQMHIVYPHHFRTQIKTGGSDVGKITVYYKGYAVLVNSFIGDDDNIGESMSRNNVDFPDGNDYVKGDFKHQRLILSIMQLKLRRWLVYG